MATIFVMVIMFQGDQIQVSGCDVINVDTNDVQNVVLLLNKMGVMFVRPFVNDFVVDMVSAMFEEEGFQLGSARREQGCMIGSIGLI